MRYYRPVCQTEGEGQVSRGIGRFPAHPEPVPPPSGASPKVARGVFEPVSGSLESRLQAESSCAAPPEGGTPNSYHLLEITGLRSDQGERASRPFGHLASQAEPLSHTRARRPCPLFFAGRISSVYFQELAPPHPKSRALQPAPMLQNPAMSICVVSPVARKSSAPTRRKSSLPREGQGANPRHFPEE